ncbi:glutathione S-transferase [Sphingomonas oleivorans]|uniref:Glutathione S-transferase n=1 Tax=Sphingomonas oleivorans TaxID=1735121 RepID=A0A2T5FZL5_9SPHN|nr:glutathione S-transferase [Sphingomonas oleivorans]PTQ12152.1 glutathione S-transferase [Sphingomonas oleivorans]
MYELYIGNKNYSSWSLRPWLLMQQLGISFHERLVPFGDGAFEAFSPSGKVPCLVDGPRLLWDSLGITEYLAERHAGVWPADPDARAWARCAAAEMHSGFGALRERCTMNLGIRVRLDAMPPSLAREIARIDALWQQGLDRFGGPFLAGSVFTAADAFFAPVAFRFMIYGIETSAPANAYAARLRMLGPMRAWYEAAIAEHWRDPEHEEEARRAGSWTADLRSQPHRRRDSASSSTAAIT